MGKQLNDRALVESGKRSARTTDCTSVIVATGIAGIRPAGRNYFLCDMGKPEHEDHHNGPDSWWIDEGSGQWHFEGSSLSDPNFAGANP